MSGTIHQLQAHYDTPIHNTRVGKDGIVEGHVIETHYVIAEVIAIGKGENWLSVIIDYQDIQLETRLPLDKLIKFLTDNIPPAEAKP